MQRTYGSPIRLQKLVQLLGSLQGPFNEYFGEAIGLEGLLSIRA